MSTTIIAVITNLLVTVLPLVGITIGGDAVQTTVQTVVAVATGLWIWGQRVQHDDINLFGIKV